MRLFFNGLMTCLFLLLYAGCADTLYEPHWSKRSRLVHREHETKSHILNVSSEPKGAKVYVDDRPAGVTPCKVSFTYKENVSYYQDFNEYWELIPFEGPEATKKVPLTGVYEKSRYPEKRDVEIKLYKSGYQHVTKVVSIPETKNVNAFLKLIVSKPRRGKQQQQQQQQQQQTVIVGDRSVKLIEKGTITIESIPTDAEIYIDGGFIGNAPLENAQLSVGKHEIVLKKQGFKNWERTVTVLANSNTRILATLEE